MRRRLGAEAAHVAYSLGWAATKRVPEGVARAVFRQVADQTWRRHGPGVRQLEANLGRAFPGLSGTQLRRESKLAMRSYLRYWCEVFRLPALSGREVVERVRTVDEHFLRDAYATGRGVVIPLPHMANWDHAGAWACLTGMPLTTVAERLEPERLFARFVAYRESLGMEVLPLTGAEDPFRAMSARLRDGRLVCLVADRDIAATGLEVSLLGEPAKLPAGPAALCRVTGAALVPATLSYAGPQLVIRFYPPVPPVRGRAGTEAMTQQVADAFSAGIRKHPHNWHMLQQVFSADLPSARPPR